MGIKEEITKIAVEQGYEGAKPKSIAQAIDALTDTLAGEDVKSGRSVVDAIRKYAPYVGGSGGGGGRVELFNETVTTVGGYATAILTFTGDTDADPLVVAFDGTEYELPRSETEDMMGTTVTYGTPLTEDTPDFSTYPLALVKNSLGWKAYIETAGTHTIVAYADSATPTPTPTLGPLQNWPHESAAVPVVGKTLGANSYLAIENLKLGNTGVCAKIYLTYNRDARPQIASGMTIEANDLNNAVFYAVTFGPETDGAYPYTSVRQLDVETGMDGVSTILVMPDLTANNETLVVVPSALG